MRAGFTLLLLVFFARPIAAQDGQALYDRHCASCHSTGVSRAPARDALRQMSPERILTSLETGTMTLAGSERTAEERRTLATFLSGRAFGSDAQSQAEGLCKDPKAPFSSPMAERNWNGWGVTVANVRFQPGPKAGLSAAEVPRLQLKWALGFPGANAAAAQPAVVGNRVFVGSLARKVYSLDKSTGCTYWIFEPDAGVRTAITLASTQSGYVALFGDVSAYVYAVHAETGKLVWKTRLDTHPAARITGAPTLHQNRLYVPVSSMEELTGANAAYECCKFRGSVAALEVETGKIVWQTYTIPEEPKPTKMSSAGKQLWGPSGAAVWSAPTIDVRRRAVYVATGDSYSDPVARTSDAIIALDLATGKMLWSRQMTEGDAWNLACGNANRANCPESEGPDFDFGSSPILVDLGGGKRALVVGQKSGVVHAVDPDREGEVLWQKKIGKGGMLGGIQWGSAADGQNVYSPLSDTALGPAGRDPKAGGGLFALRLLDGQIVWQAPPPVCSNRPGCSPAQSAAVTAIPGVVFSGASDGHFRAYSTADGKVIWDFDTVRDFTTVNGVKARGGSLDGPGATVAGGMVFVNSGYGMFGSMPGNVLLAFSVDGK